MMDDQYQNGLVDGDDKNQDKDDDSRIQQSVREHFRSWPLEDQTHDSSVYFENRFDDNQIVATTILKWNKALLLWDKISYDLSL